MNILVEEKDLRLGDFILTASHVVHVAPIIATPVSTRSLPPPEYALDILRYSESTYPFPGNVQWRDGALRFCSTAMIALIKEAIREIARRYGEQRFAIELFRDPEATTLSESIFLLIRTTKTAQEATQMLDGFANDWWLDNMDRAGGKLQISVEFA